MAKSLKPSDELLERLTEGEIEILEWAGMYGSSSGEGLIDGVSYIGYEKYTCHWYSVGSFVKFKISQKSNIWIIGSDGQIAATTRMCLTDMSGNVITGDYCNKKTSSYINNTWQEFITNLPRGEYYLFNDEDSKNHYFSQKTIGGTSNNRPIHGEWYVESMEDSSHPPADTSVLYCIKYKPTYWMALTNSGDDRAK